MHAVAPTMSSSPPDTGRRRRSPWQVVIGGGFASAVGPGPVGLSTLSLFVVPISLEMGFGRTIVTSAYTVGALGVAVGMLLVTEAGGTVTTIDAAGDPKTGASILATNAELHPALRKVLQAA